MKIGQSGVRTQLTDGFVTMAYAMLVAIGLVYLLLVMLVRLLLVPMVIFFALPLIVIGGFVSLAATGCALDLSSLIGMPMLIAIVVTNAIVLRDLAQHTIEAGADVHTVLIQGGHTHVRPILMTAAATILALIPLAPSSNDGLIAASLATVVIGGLLQQRSRATATIHYREMHTQALDGLVSAGVYNARYATIGPCPARPQRPDGSQ